MREEREVKRKKREDRELKLQKKEALKGEKEAEAAAKEAQVQGEEDYKAMIEETDGKFKREEMDAAGAKAAKKASDGVFNYYKDAQKKRAKAVADDLAEKIRLYKIEQAENEIRWHKERKANDPDHTDEEIAEALQKLTVDLPEDVVLQLWAKFHLRRSTRGGFGYRRKVYNYKDDLRDGVSYGVMMKRLGAHVITEADGNMDEEIDPQVSAPEDERSEWRKKNPSLPCSGVGVGASGGRPHAAFAPLLVRTRAMPPSPPSSLTHPSFPLRARFGSTP
jgi:hypothetical protein